MFHNVHLSNLEIVLLRTGSARENNFRASEDTNFEFFCSVPIMVMPLWVWCMYWPAQKKSGYFNDILKKGK